MRKTYADKNSTQPPHAFFGAHVTAAAQHMARGFAIFVALLSLGLAGCNLHTDLDEVRLATGNPGEDVREIEDVVPSDATNDIDTADTDKKVDAADTDSVDADTHADADDADDADTHGADADADDVDARDRTDADTPDATERVCQGEMGEIAGNCRPSRPTDCSEGQTCRLRLDTGTFQFFSHCAENSAESDNRSEGQFCQSAAACQTGLDCAAWTLPVSPNPTCARLCELESGAGCDLDSEFCSNPSPDNLNGLGFCVKRCDPGKRSADCPSGQTCTPDFGFPDAACHQNFRCLVDVRDRPKQEGEECNRSKNHLEGCGVDSGLICVPFEGTERCVKGGCRDDGDCANGCIELEGGWDFKFCAP